LALAVSSREFAAWSDVVHATKRRLGGGLANTAVASGLSGIGSVTRRLSRNASVTE
jgi:hypothetical protein